MTRGEPVTPKSQQRTGGRRPASSTRRVAPDGGRGVRAVDRSDEFAQLLRTNTVDIDRPPSRARRSPVVGKVGLALAVASVAVDASAFAVFMGGEVDFAGGICFVVVFLTVIAAVLGFVAAVGGLGRWYGVVAVFIAFAANPVVIVVVLVVAAPEVLTQFGS
ncbi:MULTISPECIES: hypothetical protein [unclassified Curtobacterium]|uniref:hypothetical protein n=1 Tax=unclassified Curtobacterium TaxID=257496 RepID=UPI000DA73910|nr:MULTISPECIES: hypothetical protein [unclassified Curtobacterium]